MSGRHDAARTEAIEREKSKRRVSHDDPTFVKAKNAVKARFADNATHWSDFDPFLDDDTASLEDREYAEHMREQVAVQAIQAITDAGLQITHAAD